jgi:predicted permease
MSKDFRYAFRNLRRSPLFVTIALLSLALGIGANSAIFTIADQVLLRPLPIRHASELVQFVSPGPQNGSVYGENRFSYPMFRDLRDHNTVFSDVAGRFSTPLNLTYNNRSERIQAELVTGGWFDTLGLDTAIGRGITPDDDRLPGAHPVVVLTYDYWRSRFHGNPAILNQKVLLNGYAMTVIGVAAPGYRGYDVGERTDALVPTMMKNEMTPTWQGLDNRRVMWLQLAGRLKPGVTPKQASARLEPYYHGLLIMEMQSITSFRSERSRVGFISKPLRFEPVPGGASDTRSTFQDPLLILLAIVALLLLIACANVANLLLARAVSRQREIAVRLAIGASRYALVRQLIAESLLLSVAGGAIGVLISWWISSALLAGSDLPINPAPDTRVFAFTFALSLLTGLLFGLVPALQATSPSIALTLKDQAGSLSGNRGHVRLRKTLVVSQVTLSLLMLIASALFTRSLRNLKNVDLGFQRDRLLSFSLDPSLAGYKPDRNRRFAEDVQSKIAALPGVRAAAIGVIALVTGDQNVSTVTIEGFQPKPDDDMNPWFDTVSPGYFRTMGIPLLTGRDFAPSDRVGAKRVAIVNDVFARYYFKNENPIGRRFGLRGDNRNPDIEIVGVVRGSKYSNVDEKIPKVAYLCYAQDTNPAGLIVYVRSVRDPKTLFPALRREVAALDSTIPVNGLRTMDEQVDQNLSAKRLMSYLSAFFAILATLLAAIGLYGVMAYTVARRTREIGIRVALGAGRSTLIKLVMIEVAALTGIGVAIAIPISFALSRLVRAQLYGIVPNDPASIGTASLILIAVALLAGYIPAERATRVDPIRALRYE